MMILSHAMVLDGSLPTHWFGVLMSARKVYIRDMTTVTPLMLALFGGTLHVHHEREVNRF